ncbi:hypothetical protein HZS_2413 [Henneguya salminicola]|nr:hypothetical protein HZS_2413 [Henneguya salminicola]
MIEANTYEIYRQFLRNKIILMLWCKIKERKYSRRHGKIILSFRLTLKQHLFILVYHLFT